MEQKSKYVDVTKTTLRKRVALLGLCNVSVHILKKRRVKSKTNSEFMTRALWAASILDWLFRSLQATCITETTFENENREAS